MDKELKETIEQELKKSEENEYSIYDYLKYTPSITIAIISAIVAIVTFFARLITIISARQELAFWEIKSEHYSMGNESFVFIFTVVIIYAFVTTLLAMWYSATYEAYLPYKKRDLTVRYFKKVHTKTIREIKRKIKKGIATDNEKEYLNCFEELRLSHKRVKKDAKRELIINVLPILFAMCIVTCFYATVMTNNCENTWSVVVACVLTQILTLYILSKLSVVHIINKKDIKNKCMDLESIEQQTVGNDVNRFPLGTLFSRGIRSALKNSTIIAIVLTLLLNCCVMCVSYAFIEKEPIERDEYFQTLTLDGVQYAIVYQNGNQYFLEESKATMKEIKGEEPREILTVYTNRQRIITCDDITIEVKKYDEIIKEHKSDNLQENQNNE